MNKQQKSPDKRGIEWTDYTWNSVGGCKHRCRWQMPDGTTAICYAEAVANGVARHAYPEGFEHHYWNPHLLNEPLKLATPAKIFLDSMSDLMGHWVPREQILQVLDICRQADWHTFQLLTKNAPRLLEFDFPPNVWVGVSMPPTQMFGKPLNFEQRQAYMKRALDVLGKVNVPVRWVSFEPLSWDVSAMVHFNPSIQWAVIGAATNGAKAYQPTPENVSRLLAVLDHYRIPVFFKGNLKWETWREEFPKPIEKSPSFEQLSLF